MGAEAPPTRATCHKSR
ncbi:hypothetical protein [Lysobacter gummosus]